MGVGAKFAEFIYDLISRRHLIVQMVRRDIESRYLGSALGFFWAYIHPTLTITILIVVFQFGLKAQPVANAPFALWLISGLVPWFFLSEAVGAGTHAIADYDYLVKKVAFRTSLLPVVKVSAALVVHAAFVLLLLFVFHLYEFPLTATAIQVVYYSASAYILLLGLTWATSALAVFVKDVIQVVNAILGFLFWLTPLCWNYDIVPANYRIALYANPFFYITEGYRKALLYEQWAWQGDGLVHSLIFWVMTLITFLCGGLLFHRLRPHFADVL